MLKILTLTWLSSVSAISIGSLLLNTADARQTTAKSATAVVASNPSHSVLAVSDKSMVQMERSPHKQGNMTIAKLNAPSSIERQTVVPLVINFQDSKGKRLGQFTTFPEKLMHLMVVSDDLQSFDLLHPVYRQNGRFEVTKSFPYGGRYILLSNFKPTGQEERVSVLKLRIDGSPAPVAKIDMATSRPIGDIKASLQLPQSGLKAGEEAMLVFKLQQSNGRLVNDLRPYLGEKGHLAIIEQSSISARIGYVHTHPYKVTNMSDGEIHFMAKFPKSGNYKIWGQFNRAGKIVIADFWVNVS